MKHSLSNALQKLMPKKKKILNFLNNKILRNQQLDLYKNEIPGADLCESMKRMKNKKI